MRLNELEIDALEDNRVLVQARCLGPAGTVAAKQHADSLVRRAMLAFERNELARAHDLSRRAEDFTRRMFGTAIHR